MQKIALFTDTFDEVNGVANTFRHLRDYCARSGRRLDFYCHAMSGRDSVEESGPVRIFRYKPAIPIEIYFDSIFDLKIPRFRIIRNFLKEKYSLIHTATPGSMGLQALAVARLGNIPIISSYHTSLPEYVHTRVDAIVKKFRLPTEHSGDRSEDLTWKFMRWYYDQTELVLAPSEFTKAQLETKLKTPVKIFSRGIDTEKFNPGWRQETALVTALYAGRVSREKNLDVIARIFSERHDAVLRVVGDGPYMEEMKRLLPHGQFDGFLKGEALFRAYASSDFFVFPSTTDTFGNVVLEAMSSGLPVVVTDKMGPKELVRDRETGFIATDEDVFAQKVDALVTNESMRGQMGLNARHYALTRSWDTIFGGLFAMYEEYAR
jgi:glycosyltransferase involved in cell wall biosynthesis